MIDTLKDLPGYALRRASTAMLADLNIRLEPLGVRHVEASVLLVIAGNPGVTQSKLGEVLGIQRANMTPLIARLEERGWLARTPIDGRSHGLILSAAGRDARAAISAVVASHELALINRIAPEHRSGFKAALDALWVV